MSNANNEQPVHSIKPEYLIDSPILVRKIFESNAVADKTTAGELLSSSSLSTPAGPTTAANRQTASKKYNLEYLFESGCVSSNSQQINSPSSNSSNLVVPACFSAHHGQHHHQHHNHQKTVMNGPGTGQTSTKPKKKIKFNFSNNINGNAEPAAGGSQMSNINSSQSPLHTATSNDDSNDKFALGIDDDCILPVRMTNQQRGNNGCYPKVYSGGSGNGGGNTLPPASTFRFTNDLNRGLPHPQHLLEQQQQQYQAVYHSNTLNGSKTVTGNNANLSYKKCSIQPEDNIWVKKFNTSAAVADAQYHHQQQQQQYANQYRYQQNQQQQQMQQHQSVMNAEYVSNRTAVLYGPNDKEVVL
jgi:hypothetical protein